MNILVLNGSPRPNGNTRAMVEAFAEGTRENGSEEKLTELREFGRKIGKEETNE